MLAQEQRNTASEATLNRPIIRVAVSPRAMVRVTWVSSVRPPGSLRVPPQYRISIGAYQPRGPPVTAHPTMQTSLGGQAAHKAGGGSMRAFSGGFYRRVPTAPRPVPIGPSGLSSLVEMTPF